MLMLLRSLKCTGTCLNEIKFLGQDHTNMAKDHCDSFRIAENSPVQVYNCYTQSVEHLLFIKICESSYKFNYLEK